MTLRRPRTPPPGRATTVVDVAGLAGVESPVPGRGVPGRFRATADLVEITAHPLAERHGPSDLAAIEHHGHGTVCLVDRWGRRGLWFSPPGDVDRFLDQLRALGWPVVERPSG